MDAELTPKDWDLTLSCYFDGELSAEEEATLFVELEKSTDLQIRFNQMKKLQETLQVNFSNQLSDESTLPTVWQSIAEKLKQPQESALTDYEFELLTEDVSAYHDNELNEAVMPHIERSLTEDKTHASLLSNFQQMSQAISQLTENCDIDIAAQVMAKLTQQNETELQSIEILSAHLDGELKTQDIIEVNRLLESSGEAKSQFLKLNTLHDLIQQSNEKRIASTDIDLWASIEKQLLADNVVPIASKSKQSKLLPFNKAIWLGAPMAAAAALLVLSWPALQVDNLMGTEITLGDTSTASTQIASFPKLNNMGLSRLSSNGESVPVIPALPVLNQKAGSPTNDNLKAQVILVPSKPILDPATRQLATRRIAIKTDATAFKNKSGKKTPSSDEYLFHALEEQGSGAEFSNLLND
jgi:hypothetical protein